MLFERLAERGRIDNREQFKKLGDRQGHAIWEFKRHQIRFLGGFTAGKQFLLAHGLRKKQDKHRAEDFDRTGRVLSEHVSRQHMGGS